MNKMIRSIVRELGDSIMFACVHKDVPKMLDLLLHEKDLLLEVYTGSATNIGLVGIPFDLSVDMLRSIVLKVKDLSKSDDFAGVIAFITLEGGKVFHTDIEDDDDVEVFMKKVTEVRYR